MMDTTFVSSLMAQDVYTVSDNWAAALFLIALSALIGIQGQRVYRAFMRPRDYDSLQRFFDEAEESGRKGQ